MAKIVVHILIFLKLLLASLFSIHKFLDKLNSRYNNDDDHPHDYEINYWFGKIYIQQSDLKSI